MTTESASILIVDDEALVRRVLGDGLLQAGYSVHRAASGAEAIASLEATAIDLILLDLQLGDDDGVEVMRDVRSRWPSLPIIILTAHGSMNSAIEALRHDAADYLLKPIGMEPLRARVAEVIQRHRASRERSQRIRSMYQQLQALVEDEGIGPQQAAASATAPDSTLSVGPLYIDVSQHMVRMAGQPIELTPTEFAIIHALARQPGVVIPCVQLIQSFQGGQLDEDEARTVMRPHIVRLRRKIEADPQRPRYIQSVRGVGYRWSDHDGMSDPD